LQSVLLNFIEELAAADPEQACGARAVPAFVLERLADHATLGFGQNVTEPQQAG
jgi:hypothetical protein